MNQPHTAAAGADSVTPTPVTGLTTAEQAEAAGGYMHQTVTAVESVILGKRRVIQLSLATLLAGGHMLLEDAPGTGKTMLARALAAAISVRDSRIQFTPDLLPGDIIGTNIYNQSRGEFEFHRGPVFANIVLADEINRASPKTQAALLEAMAEQQVTIDRETHSLQAPFMVIATQNPIEQAGTYELPEAQLDRFMIKTSIGFPDDVALQQILGGTAASTLPESVLPSAHLQRISDLVKGVFVSAPVLDYVRRIMVASHTTPELLAGVSVRGGLALLQLARAWALLHARHYVLPEDIADLASVALAHRVVLSADAVYAGVTQEQVIQAILASEPAPSDTAEN